MWLMTGFGILMPAIRPPKTVKLGDDRTMQIRARRAKDLDILRAQYMPGKLGPTLHTPDKDYEYRAYCAPEAFALAVARMITEIDYLKFKPVTEDRYADKELHSCYNGIWSVVMRDLSTVKHQWEYWNRPGVATTPAGAGRRGVDLGTNGVTTGAGWGCAEAAYPGSFSLPAGSVPTEHRGSGYDRDTYDPEVWDTGPVSATGDAYLDALYVEIDDLERALVDPITVDHTHCRHGNRSAARLKCRNNRIEAWRARLAECRVEVDTYYDTLGTTLIEGGPIQVAESDEVVTVVAGDGSVHHS